MQHKMLQRKIFLLCFAIGIFHIYHIDAKAESKSSKESIEKTSASSSTLVSVTSPEKPIDGAKDKRELTSKETQIYPNHRSEAEVIDDPEDGQETIYGPKPNPFLIRPVSPHQHQQHEDHQQPQLRNYPATLRPISQQLLEQSQEVQHYAYLHELSRTHPVKSIGAVAAAAQLQAKTKAVGQHKKSARPTPAAYSTSTTATEEAEQRYAYAVEPQGPQPQPQPQLRHFHPSPRYHITAPPAQHLQLQQPQPQQHLQQREPQQHSQQQQYQIIPEEQFLKLIEEELQARAYHDAQIRQQHNQQQHQQQQHQHHQQQQHHQQHQQRQQHQQHQQQQQHQQHQQHQQAQSQTDASNKVEQQIAAAERSGASGLGNYRQHIAFEPSDDEYIQYIRPKQRSGPKYLPEPETQHAQLEADPTGESPVPLPHHLAYYPQPHHNYKTLSNHPLAKSSLEKEIENLIAANKQAASLQFVDSTNEPSAVVNQHRQPPQHYQPRQLIHQQQKQASTFVSSTTPNSLVDANNQPFIPSLFRFSQYQTPTPIYPTQQGVTQQMIDAKKLGPVVYPTTAPAATPSTQPQTQPQPQAQPQPTQYYHYNHEPAPSPRPYRSKQYGLKIATPTPHIKASREKEAKLQLQYSQPLVYDYERHEPQVQSAGDPIQFYPSPKDPNPTAPADPRPTIAVPLHAEPPPNFRQYILPAAAPSQSSIYVSQGTGITTPSRPIHRESTGGSSNKPKTAEDVKQLHLPQPGGKPLTQAEFQALVDAGYPVTAVPVPVPVPYEQYLKDHPEHRNQPVDYPLTRFAQQYPQQLQHQHQQHQHQHQHQYRNLAAQSEPAVKIVSSPSEPKVATAIGGGGITYLRPIVHGQQRRPRDEQKETAVEGKKEEA